jgi:Cu-Zn family superoxide dismutase
MLKTIAAAALVIGTAAAAQPPRERLVSGALFKADGTQIGAVLARRAGSGIIVDVIGSGLAPGRYGAHVHAVGRCEGPGFESAGPHWNPTARRHGRRNPAGHHLGDLPNLEIGATRVGRIEFTIPRATLAGLLDADGASLVIHAAPDDERTDPSGNSGARIACAVLRG